ncbi:hypothetical protein Tco_0577772 [Tanacetum coccineum]
MGFPGKVEVLGVPFRGVFRMELLGGGVGGLGWWGVGGGVRTEGTENYEEYELNNPVTRDLEEPWLDKGVPYQLCHHICEPYHLKNGVTKWLTCSLDIDGFCNGGELPGMVWVGSMTYF